MENYSGRCQTTMGKHGRSVKIQCDDIVHPTPTSSSTPVVRYDSTFSKVVYHTDTVTENHVSTMLAMPKVVTTMMAVPKIAVPYVDHDEFE